MAAGRLIRLGQALDAAGDVLCTCGHRVREHHELRDVLVVEDGLPRYERHPKYEPLHFYCDHDGCDCVRVEESRR